MISTTASFQDRLIPASHALAHLEQLGGKARSLALLQDAEFPIPPWFVIAPGAAISGEETVPLSWQEPLQQAVREICPDGERVAVRSSALDEDGLAHSFAGQLESFLDVAPEAVAQAVEGVWQSGWSDRLLTYRREQGLTQPPQAPAVLVQRMVAATVAGVAFSADPVSGRRGVAVVSAVRGLGDRLVSGEADAETWQVKRDGAIASHQAGEEATGLSEEQVRAIATLARRAAHHFGRPQDIEWAMDGSGDLWLLQSRPITTLATLPDPDGRLLIWDNSNIAESYGGITTPLTFSFARRAYEAVYREFCRLMRVPAGAIAQNDSTFRCMLGLVRGRIYYNLLNWYRVLALLPGFRVNRRFMEQMMGVTAELPADVLYTLESSSVRDKVNDGLRLANTLLGLVGNYATLPRQIRRFYQRLDAALTLPPNTLTQWRSDELVAYYHRLEQSLLTHWDAPLVNDFFAMIFYGVLQKLTVAWCHDTAGTLQNDLISGEGGMISAEPAQRVRQLAQVALAYPALILTLQQGSLAEIRRAIAQVPTFQADYEAYLEKFGDRCLEELKLESPTLHDDPMLLLRSVGHLAQRLQTHPLVVRSPQDSPRFAAKSQVTQALKGHPLRRALFGWVLQNARSRVRDRENLRFERTRVFGRVRRILLEVGQRLTTVGAIATPRDIFYLTLEEILGYVEGTASCTDLAGMVNVRQAEFEGYHQDKDSPELPDRFATFGAVHPLIPQPAPAPATAHSAAAPAADDPDRRQGLGCCPGIVRAPVQVITDPKNAVLQPGHILVAERTDPGWILLFPAAAGLLVERGSLLSHSAIVSREMGIPAIVSIPHLTHWLHTGDWVELNGSTGTIHRIPPPPLPVVSQP